MRLRPRQHTAVDASLAALEKHNNTLLVAPTGAGKTIMLSAVGGQRIAQAKKHKRPEQILILQHRDELTDQNRSKFLAVNPGTIVSTFNSKNKSFGGRAVFAMVQTLMREANLSALPAFNTVIVDEAHHITADSYMRIIERAREANPDVAIFGVTATPNRGDGTGLRKVFNNVADQITIGELIASGHLVRPRTYVIDVGAQKELAGVRKLISDFDMNAVAAIMDRKVITDKVVGHWKQQAGDRQTVVFCSNVAHAEHVTEFFNKAGVSAATVHGNLGSAERASILTRYARRSLQVIVNVAVLTEGWDHPPTSCVVLLRPSSYKSTMIQMVGRGLRTVNPEEWPGVVKTNCIALDFGTSTLMHGSLEQDANLDGHEPGKAPTKECPSCGAEVPISTMECPLCDHVWERDGAGAKEKIDLTDFVLTEVDLLAKSNFKWVDIWGDAKALIACGFEAWAGIFWLDGVWHAVGGSQTEIKHLGVGDRIVALALGDDYLNEHESEANARKNRRWLQDPATPKQMEILGMRSMVAPISKYEAMCQIGFRRNRRAIQDIVTN